MESSKNRDEAAQPDKQAGPGHPESLSEDKVFEIQASVGRVMANPKRLEVLYHLKEGEKTVSELVKAMDIPPANLSQHLSVLRSYGVLVTRREGQFIYYRVVNRKVSDACSLMRESLMDLVSHA